MNDKQLKYFQLIVQEGTFNKAAKKAFVSVQAVKKQIDSLENELDVRLFDRTHTGSELTLAGQRFSDGLKVLIPKFQQLITDTKADQQKEEITICFPSNLFISKIEEYCSRFEELHPEVDFHFISLEPDQWLSAINDGKADLCVYTDVPEIDKYELQSFPISGPINLMCVVNRENPLATKSQLTLSDLNNQKLAVNGLETYDDLLAKLNSDNIDYSIVNMPVDKLSLLEFCKNSGIYIMTEIDANELNPLVCLPLKFKPMARRWVSRKNISDTLKDFIEFASEKMV